MKKMNESDLVKAVMARDILQQLEDIGIEADKLDQIEAFLWKPDLVKELDPWSVRYLTKGHLWGDEPSACAQYVLDHINPGNSVLDLGCGYGRDSKVMADHGLYVLGLDNSLVAVIDTMAALSDHIQNGRAHVEGGDIVSAKILQNDFHAVSSHRMFHLPNPKKIPQIVHRMAGVLHPGGLLVLSARSPEDFNPEQMNRIDEYTAVYKDRPTHYINFYDEARLQNTLSKKFRDFSFMRGQEMESIGNVDKNGDPVMSSYVRVVAHKKTEEEMHKNGDENGASPPEAGIS